MITNTERGTDCLQRLFQALTHHFSVSSYARVELRLVWSLIKAYELGAKESPYTLNKAQQTALKALYQDLEKNPDSAACLQHLNTLLRSPFWDPKPQGSAYRSWFLIPPMPVKIQHNMHLCFLGILQGFDKASSADYELNLGEISMQPFATIHQWIHEMSVEVKDLLHPSIARWEGEVTELGKGICFDATNSTFDNWESQAFMTLLAGALGVTVQSTAQERVVCPIELFAIFNHLIPSEHHQMFVPGGGFEGMGVCEFRHFTIAIQRQKLQVVYNKDQGAQTLMQTAGCEYI
ncbi:hypothetical protein BXZ70DRAFT_910996 [Cristinia sonorae]|uniref:Uncharacterized protein n=1 Tax=Cristinia sonorae TaxID=1940300 RepID=A0A8K0XKH2_9AGAR|nr:hypothetical protein BXZ70DRAFT_910996 [Cristinia sonorae]